MTPTFQGEVQMRRWSNSSTQGIQVTFALADEADLEPLKAKAGKRFAAVLIEIGDDEQPVEPAKPRDQRGPLCREACDLSGLPAFQEWAHETADYVGEPDEESAKAAILEWCGVNSRKDLDVVSAAGERFIRHVRAPFLRWQRERKAA